MKPRDGMFIQFACAANQKVAESSYSNESGLFTKHLLRKIDAENIPVDELFTDISNAVERKSRGRQRPLSMNGFSGRNAKVFLNKVVVIGNL